MRLYLTTLGFNAAGDDAAGLAGDFVHEDAGVVTTGFSLNVS